MPLDRFVFIVLGVIAAAAITIAVAVWVQTVVQLPALGLLLLVPIALIAYVVVRVIQDRLREHAEDGDKYEGR